MTGVQVWEGDGVDVERPLATFMAADPEYLATLWQRADAAAGTRVPMGFRIRHSPSGPTIDQVSSWRLFTQQGTLTTDHIDRCRWLIRRTHWVEDCWKHRRQRRLAWVLRMVGCGACVMLNAGACVLNTGETTQGAVGIAQVVVILMISICLVGAVFHMLPLPQDPPEPQLERLEPAGPVTIMRMSGRSFCGWTGISYPPEPRAEVEPPPLKVCR